MFIFKVFLPQGLGGWGGLNNHRKLSATPRQSYLDLVPEETGTEAWKQVFLCCTHPLFENKMMDDSFDLCYFLHGQLVKYFVFLWVCEGVNGLQAQAKYVVKFLGLCLIKLHVGALD